LGLIAAVRSSKQLERTSTVTVGGRRIEVKVGSLRGIPVGSDADIMLAIQTLYVLTGCPPDRTVRTTPYELLKLSTLGYGGKAYRRLREGIVRLAATHATIKDGWYDPVRGAWRSIINTFQFLDKFSYRDLEVSGAEIEFDGDDSPLTFVLSSDVASSLLKGYLRLNDVRVLEELKEPSHRTLYRFFDAHRLQPDGTVLGELRFETAVVAKLCGLGTRPDNVRRLLNDLCAELSRLKVLEHFEVIGQGAGTVWHLQFASSDSPEIQELISLLRANRCTPAVSEKLGRTYSPDAIRRAVRIARELEERGRHNNKPVRSLGGLTVSILENPDKYADPATPLPVFAPPTTTGAVPMRVLEAPALVYDEADLSASVRIFFKLSPRSALDLKRLEVAELRSFHDRYMQVKKDPLAVRELTAEFQERLTTLADLE